MKLSGGDFGSISFHGTGNVAITDLLEAGFAPFVDFSIADRAALDCCAELEVLADRAARG